MAKTVNYTDEQVTVMRDMYAAVVGASDTERDAVVDQLAAMFGKKRRSVVAKLSNLKIYQAKTPVAKDGEPSVRKDVLAARLSEVSGVTLTSAENLTKEDLKRLIVKFEELAEEVIEICDAYELGLSD